MSSTSMDVPTLQVNENDLRNLVSFIYKHERLLKEFGAIKVQPNIECKLALKKRRKSLVVYPTTEKIVKMNKDECIYSVQKVNRIDKITQQSSLVIDEGNFWSSLSYVSNEQRQINISLTPNKSFFSQKTSRTYFDIHRLPNQSLLKLSGGTMVSQFVPCVRRAHGSGAIFPLVSAQQRLFSIDYHHEGGAHHWYIIPTRKREALRSILNHQNSSICLDHGQLFIDPSVLDKNHIRYSRIIQRPNEFVVLSAGTLAQSFTEDASWSESIVFALPSWIEEGHANVSVPSCQSHIPRNYVSATIDLTVFRPALIKKFINSHLNITTNDKSQALKEDDGMNMVTVETPSRIEYNPSDVETMLATNLKLIIPVRPILPYLQSPPASLITPPISSYSGEHKTMCDDNNAEMEYDLLEKGGFWDAFDRETSDIPLFDSISSVDLSEFDAPMSQLDQSTDPSINIHQNITNICNTDNYSLSLDELTDLLPYAADTVGFTHTQTDENIGTSAPSPASSNTHTTPTNTRSHMKKERILNQTRNNHRTLFVSGLRSNVTKMDIRSHFIGCTKVTIKQYRTTLHLKYAFVVHQTFREAERNVQRPIDFHRLGFECRVEYASDCSTPSNNRESFDKKKVAVSGIPANVTENELHYLFGNRYIIKYCPARTVHLATTTTTMKDSSKTLSGYAFILFHTEQQAASVIEHADQYRINGQPLVISLYEDKKSSHATARELFVD